MRLRLLTARETAIAALPVPPTREKLEAWNFCKILREERKDELYRLGFVIFLILGRAAAASKEVVLMANTI